MPVPAALRPAYQWLAAMDPVERMQFALVVSIAIHAFVIFCVTFKPFDRFKEPSISPSLEVVLVNARSKTAPVKADTLAQANLDGGGTTDADRRAKSPLPVVQQDKNVSEASLAASRIQQLEAEQRKLMTQTKSPTRVAAATTQPAPQADPVPAPVLNAADMVKNLEIARLEAQIDKQMDAYNKRPRRNFVGARTQEFRFAQYIEDWRLKVQRIGSINYPEAARGIYGELRMTVSIRADGSVEKIEINKSSGKRLLDDAAMRIVQLASPYSPFPPDISRDTDVLSITRTWFFTRSDQFVAE
ncbi:MAG: energy transducer TonB [Burkholderiales bacterium]